MNSDIYRKLSEPQQQQIKFSSTWRMLHFEDGDLWMGLSFVTPQDTVSLAVTY